MKQFANLEKGNLVALQGCDRTGKIKSREGNSVQFGRTEKA